MDKLTNITGELLSRQNEEERSPTHKRTKTLFVVSFKSTDLINIIRSGIIVIELDLLVNPYWTGLRSGSRVAAISGRVARLRSLL